MQLINVWAACRDEHLPVVCVLWHFQKPGCLITDVISDPPVMVVIDRVALFSCLLLVFQPSVNRVETESIKKEQVEPKNTFGYMPVHKWQWLPSQAPQKLVCPLTLTSLHSSTSSFMQVLLSEIQNLKNAISLSPLLPDVRTQVENVGVLLSTTKDTESNICLRLSGIGLLYISQILLSSK